MSEPPPRRHLVERTENHAIGVFDDLVIACLFRGSAEDPRHVTATAEAVRATSVSRAGKVRLLFILRDAAGSKPPSGAVRAAIKEQFLRHEGLVSHVVVVIVGEGFGAAAHRAVASTLATLYRPSIRLVIVAEVHDGLTRLLGTGSGAALRFCERELLSGGKPTS